MADTLEEASDDGGLGSTGNSKKPKACCVRSASKKAAVGGGSKAARPSSAKQASQPSKDSGPKTGAKPAGASAGRRRLSATEHAEREVAACMKAHGNSHYVSEQWPNMRRCLRRYIAQAQDEVEKATEDKVHNASFNMRKLQYIE